MGGGGLRILGHKKWHVWRRENIERVHRDEHAHEQQQRQEQAVQRRVEQEQRAQALTSTSTSTSGGERERASAEEDKDRGQGGAAAREHINFFGSEQDEQEQQEQQRLRVAAGGNKRGDRKSSRQHQQQETLGAQGHLPWYAKSSAGSEAVDEETARAMGARKEQKRKRSLEHQDPLKYMRPRRSSFSSDDDGGDDAGRRTGKRSRDTDERTERVYKSDYSRHSSSKSTRAPSSRDGTPANVVRQRETSSSPERDPKKKSKHESKKKWGKGGANESVLLQLRREREEREQRERRRADALMRGR